MLRLECGDNEQYSIRNQTFKGGIQSKNRANTDLYKKKVGPGAIHELASSDDRLYTQWILNIPIFHTYLYLLYILIIRILKNP